MKHGIPLEKIYFGVDVWAQNKTKLTQPRVTYPERGGGGTNTGVAVKKLSDMGLSAGVFAPAWSFEHFTGDIILDTGPEMDRVMWEGCDPPNPDTITCSCGDARQRHAANRKYPITAAAVPFPANSDMFFYTDFSMPFAHHGGGESQKLYNSMKLHSQLGAQSILPHPPKEFHDDEGDDAVSLLTPDIQNDGNRAYLCITTIPRNVPKPSGRGGLRTYEQTLPLFRLDMPADGTLQLSLSYLYPSHNPVLQTLEVYLKFTDSIKKIKLEDCEPSEKTQTIDQRIKTPEGSTGFGRLLELGVHIRSNAAFEQTTRILDIFEIRIVPQDYPEVSRYYAIHDISIQKRGANNTQHWRLKWDYVDNRLQKNDSTSTLTNILRSDVTGPFSHFVVMMEGLDLGRFYARECVLPAHFVEELAGRYVRCELIGFGFDGREIARCKDEHVEVPP